MKIFFSLNCPKNFCSKISVSLMKAHKLSACWYPYFLSSLRTAILGNDFGKCSRGTILELRRTKIKF